MKKNKEQTNVPELRFPEFRESGEWADYILEDIGVISTGKTPSTKNTANWGGDILFITPTDISLDSKYQNNTERTVFPIKGVNILDSGSIVYTCIASIGKMAMTTKPSTTNQQINSVTVKKGFNNNFVFYYLLRKTPLIKQLPASSTLPIINKTEFSKIKIGIPFIYSEQQKIADCLSSLDELITAESEQLTALKTHKTGLMQQLFPSEGETTPKFRFPEFQNDGEWEAVKFKKLIKLYRGSSPRPITQFMSNDGNGVNWIKIGDTKNAKESVISKVEEQITIEGSKKSRQVFKGELILANSMSYGATYLLGIDGCIYDGWFVLREYENSFDKLFLLQLLNSNYLQKQYAKLAAGGIVKNISSEIVYDTFVPEISIKEQQKIADCLSSLDALITAQAEKIEQLKKHKKGLMQQLFPSMDGVSA